MAGSSHGAHPMGLIPCRLVASRQLLCTLLSSLPYCMSSGANGCEVGIIEAEAEVEASAKGRGRGKGSRDSLNMFRKSRRNILGLSNWGHVAPRTSILSHCKC